MYHLAVNICLYGGVSLLEWYGLNQDNTSMIGWRKSTCASARFGSRILHLELTSSCSVSHYIPTANNKAYMHFQHIVLKVYHLTKWKLHTFLCLSEPKVIVSGQTHCPVFEVSVATLASLLSDEGILHTGQVRGFRLHFLLKDYLSAAVRCTVKGWRFGTPRKVSQNTIDRIFSQELFFCKNSKENYFLFLFFLFFKQW